MIEISEEDADRIAERVQSILAQLQGHEGTLLGLEESKGLLFEWTQSPSLRAHMFAVEAVMCAYANRLGEDELAFRTVGLLHDLDYEKHPAPTEHPLVASELLIKRNYPREIIEAILGHASYTKVERKTQLAKTLYAVDELTGFLTAIAYVRPSGLEGLSYKSFKKKLKTPSFAAAIDRGEIVQGAEELGVDLSEHVLFVARALSEAFPNFPKIAELES